ncbi:MAG: hypothetical protein JKY92_00850 [Magnetovibrio sp.]|nr:hypothetical protein [Magnetovibrio sp.]
MSAPERARLVCERDSAFNDQQKKIIQLDGVISEIDEAMARGYRIHKGNCRKVASKTSIQTIHDCESAQDPYACIEKQRSASIEDQTVCDETPVPLNRYDEIEYQDRLRQDKRQLKNEMSRAHTGCLKKIQDLSPEEAFKIYRGSAY